MQYVLQGDISVSFCSRCKDYALWHGSDMTYPTFLTSPPPVQDMPTDVKKDYLEAGSVLRLSPRSAAALLRLAIQKLMIHLGENGKDLNDDVASLVKKGLPEKIQKALDSIRVVGNNAVHPGQLDIKDDQNTALALFELSNVIVDVMITKPKKIDEIYRKIPDSAREAIAKRDAGAKRENR